MDWNQERVGIILQTARLQQGLSLSEVERMTGVKRQYLRELEHGRCCRRPRRDKQAKLEATLGVSLPILRGGDRTVTIYVSGDQWPLITEAATKFSGESQSKAIMMALKEWSVHQAALQEWRDHHGGKI